MKLRVCWSCGKHKTSIILYGYPVCRFCKATFDPEEAEMVVIETLKQGRLVTLKELRERV